MKRKLWIITMTGCFFGFLYLFEAIFSSNSGPQQAAGAAIAIGLCVIPYCFTKAYDGMLKEDESQKNTTE